MAIWLSWDVHNIVHIARHMVTPTEVEQVVFDPASQWLVHDTHRLGRRVVRGETATGRPLVVILEPPTPAGRSYCVTARPMSPRERREYQGRTDDQDNA